MNPEIFQASRKMMSDAKFFMDYSRWDDSLGRYENWNEAVARVMNMHREKYKSKMTPELEALIDFAQKAYEEKLTLGSQRALQFGGEQIFKHPSKLYNCSASYVDRPRFFQEAMYLLLAGCGVGFSVQRHHVAKLPALASPNAYDCAVHFVEDSIEGWSDAFGVLLSSYLTADAPFPAYSGKVVYFNVTKIRPKGAKISGGFKAPGPDGLVRSLEKCRQLLDSIVENANGDHVRMRPIHAYDFVMHMADAVLSGGIRRAATICIFSKDDQEMLNAKTGDWYTTNPQRGRSNNSVLLVRNELQPEEWSNIMDSVRQFGEPGFIFANDTEVLVNPCVEIGLRGYTEDGRSGFQKCNLTEINGGECYSLERYLRACKAAAIMGTLQAGYTDFKYLSKESQEITERESLLGCSITGWMNNPHILFNEENMRAGARLIKEVNASMAKLLGINAAARCTTVKPSGNASTILGCASGIHGEHSPRYIRNVQMNNQDEVTQLLLKLNPKMCEESHWSPNKTDSVVSFPIVCGEHSIFKSDLYGVKQLEYVKLAQQVWIEEGTNVELCVQSDLRHNISNTISVDNWDEVGEYIYNNRDVFAGISLLSSSGDRDYVQAPFTEVFTAEQLVQMYGNAAMFASGLIVDGCHAFNNNLWRACDTAMGFGEKLGEPDAEQPSETLLKRDWVRRFKKFANNFFDGDLKKASYCLKDNSNLHKWESIVRSMRVIDFTKNLTEQTFTEVDSMGAQGCSGGACEIAF